MIKINKEIKFFYCNLFKSILLISYLFFVSITLSVSNIESEQEKNSAINFPINIDKLKEIDDNEDFLIDILESYIKSTSADLEYLLQSFDNNDWEKAIITVNVLKENAMAIYAPEMTDILNKLEKEIKETDKNKGNIQKLLLNIPPVFGRIKEFINQFNNNLDI